MMMREQQWDRSNCRHFRIDVCLHQRIYMRAFVNARSKMSISTQLWLKFTIWEGVSYNMIKNISATGDHL